MRALNGGMPEPPPIVQDDDRPFIVPTDLAVIQHSLNSLEIRGSEVAVLPVSLAHIHLR
jgi:hypothetical protein